MGVGGWGLGVARMFGKAVQDALTKGLGVGGVPCMDIQGKMMSTGCCPTLLPWLPLKPLLPIPPPCVSVCLGVGLVNGEKHVPPNIFSSKIITNSFPYPPRPLRDWFKIKPLRPATLATLVWRLFPLCLWTSALPCFMIHTVCMNTVATCQNLPAQKKTKPAPHHHG